jgi:Domain of unknown function (DUF1906)
MKGLDASTNCSKLAKKIKAQGFDFVGRYYAHRGDKRLFLSEAQALSGVGLKMVAVWEDAPTKPDYFSRARGVDDGTTAYHSAMILGQPAGTSIYFAVDFDASADAIAGSVADYFKGVADGFVTIAGNQQPAYLVGVYGSGATCSWLLAHHLATYTWLAQSRGWSGFKEFDRWNIKQGEETKVLGIDVDTDMATDDYGGFALPMV